MLLLMLGAYGQPGSSLSDDVSVTRWFGGLAPTRLDGAEVQGQLETMVSRCVCAGSGAHSQSEPDRRVMNQTRDALAAG